VSTLYKQGSAVAHKPAPRAAAENCPFAWRDLDRHLIRGSLDPTDRLTSYSTCKLTIGRIYVRSTAMRPNNICQSHTN